MTWHEIQFQPIFHFIRMNFLSWYRKADMSRSSIRIYMKHENQFHMTYVFQVEDF